MSQFNSLFKTNAEQKSETKSKNNPPEKKRLSASLSPAGATAATAKREPPAKPEKRGGGKSSSADYTQVLTYIKKDTHNAVKAALIYDAEKRDLSDLVEELLAVWLKKNR